VVQAGSGDLRLALDRPVQHDPDGVAGRVTEEELGTLDPCYRGPVDDQRDVLVALRPPDHDLVSLLLHLTAYG
jgi:hypothetical protein